MGSDPYPDTVHIGQVRYSDVIKGEPISRFDVLLTKSLFYEFERELCPLILEFPPSEGGEKRPYLVSVGRTVAVDLDVLIEQVYLSPFAASWF